MFVSPCKIPPDCCDDHSDVEIKDPAYGTLSRDRTIWGRAVEITEVGILDDDNLVERLTDMRERPDKHRFDASTFTYFFLDPGMKIRIAFKVPGEAVAFAQQFRGLLVVVKI